MEPEELRAEQRWSSIPQQSGPNGYWPKHLDEQILVLVKKATTSGDRFPVGVNWLDISRSIGFSPVECLKRYAFLHHTIEHTPRDHQNTVPQTQQTEATQQSDDPHNPFATIHSSGDLNSPHSRAFLEYGSPLASPRLQSLENSGEFGVGSPASPPPFALRSAGRQDRGAASPLRWESIAAEIYTPPLLKDPPHVLRNQQLRTSFGVAEPEESESKRSVFEDSQSPRIVIGTQHHSKFTDPNFAADIVHHAFKDLRFDEDLPPPSGTSPRIARQISNSDFPFIGDDDQKNARVAAIVNAAAPGSGSRFVPRPRPFSNVQNTPPLASSPGSQMLSSFQGDHPFSGSLTQSALEDAFLDMAGSRLDTSSMLFASRYAASQTRSHGDQQHEQRRTGQTEWGRTQRP